LRHNRFFYPAWLWQSRILTRQEYISKALDEAYRWGNHDQDVWREGRKIRPNISEDEAPVKRCFFCWSILKEAAFCNHCRAHLSISGHTQSAGLKDEEIRFALSHFTRALQLDKTNARAAFALALGYFNLKEYQRALNYLRLATKLSPQTSHYAKSLSTLMAVADRSQPSRDNTTFPQKNSISKSSGSILMVEDSMTSRKVLSMLFNRHGYHPLEAASGAEAIEIAKHNSPDIILLDVMLPDTNGHELLERLRRFDHLSKVPVLMLTGRHDPKDKMKGLQGGVSEYLTKPVSPQRLIELIQGYLQPGNLPANGKQSDQTGNTPAVSPVSPAYVTQTLPTQKAALTGQDLRSPVQAAKNGSKSIFVIEDSRTSRKVLAMLLGRNGYTIHEATTGMEALQLAPTITPDLVLLDVQLPDTTGYTILPQLKQIPHFAQLPVIMLTGKREAKDRMQGLLAGTNEYLTKPFDPQKLLSVINGYLQL
jgi:twitching motility two-component system response regulator PilG